MLTYAVDAAVAVALANTLFFAAATAESKTNVALYLAITVAPFAVVAPVIGPLLDRLQRGRRAALAVSFAGRAVLAIVMALNYDSWLLYPAALGMLVLSKSFVVLKAAVTPRVLPPTITLVTTNSRLTTFGLVAGRGVRRRRGRRGRAVGLAGRAVLHRGAGRGRHRAVPAHPALGGVDRRARCRPRCAAPPGHAGTPMSRGVLIRCGATASIRMLTGFLTLFVAFVVKAQTEAEPDAPAAAASASSAPRPASGAFLGNAVGAGAAFGHPDAVVLCCIGAAVAAAVLAALLPGIATAAVVGLVGADGQRAGQGLPGRGDPARPARGVPRLGVRPLGDGAAAGLGVRRRARRAAAARQRTGSASPWSPPSSRWSGCRPRCSAAAARCCPFRSRGGPAPAQPGADRAPRAPGP